MTARPGDIGLLRLLAAGIRPDPRRSVAEWAEAERVVSEGAYEGRWRNARAPYLVEIMERMSLYCPTRRVTLLASAQIGKTQCGLNMAGQILTETPAQVLVVLPSLNSLRMYNRDKLDRMIQGTPALANAVADVTERSGQGSTTAVKRGARGAQIELVTASSSRDLQSRTARAVIMEEVSEYEADVGGRGDPVEQAEARTIQWRKRGEKIIKISTPAVKGSCRITAAWEAGSRGDYQVPCPHCGTHQVLRFQNLSWSAGQPQTARYVCEDAGCVIEESSKAGMLAAGAWVHEHPDRVELHASYRLNTLYSPFTPWAAVAEQAEKAERDPTLLKTFTQQWLGEAWDEAFDLPKAEILLLRRDAYPTGRVPPGVLFMQAATDVQGDRLEWAVWGFDQAFGQWLIDKGVIEGDPTRPAVWGEHDKLLARTWQDAWGRSMQPEAWGVDAGYLSTHVYAYCRSHADRTAPRVRALDGRDGWRLPPLGTPSQRGIDWNGQRIGTVQLWPVGTWDMKSEMATALRLTEQGPGPEGWQPGALRFSELADLGWLNQLLAERFVENPKNGKRSWVKVSPRNEAWDIAVYCRAQARHDTAGWTDETWAALMARRLGPPEAAHADLAALWVPDLRAKAEEALRAAQAPQISQPPAPPPQAPGWTDRPWFGGARNYFGG